MKHVDRRTVEQDVSRLLDEVDRGETVVVTEGGRPIARIVPATEDVELAHREAAKKRFFDRLARREPWTAPRWTREELYDDEPYPETTKE